MLNLHPDLLPKVLDIRLAQGFSIERDRSAPAGNRFVLMMRGSVMTNSLTVDEMAEVLEQAAVAKACVLAEDLLK
jgi:hypothetical protein